MKKCKTEYGTTNPPGQGETMIYPASNTLSALAAFRKQLNVTANNVANVQSQGYQKSRVTFSEGQNGGVVPSVIQIDTPGTPKETIFNDRVVETESSNVDLAEELTEMISAKAGYMSNLKPFKVQDDMLGALLNIKG